MDSAAVLPARALGHGVARAQHAVQAVGSIGPGLCVPRAAAGRALAAVVLAQVFSQIRNEHFSSVFGFLSQKSRNLQAQYDVSVTLGCVALSLAAWPPPPHAGWPPALCSQHQPLLSLPQRRRGMDIKQMKDFVSQELKGLKQEHRLLSLRRSLRGRGALRGCAAGAGGPGCALQGQGRGCWPVLTVPAEPSALQSQCLLAV